MNVIIIMACTIIGTIAMLFFAGSARWSMIYLIRYRLLRCEVKNQHFEMSTKRDIIAAFIAVITLIVTALLLVYGVPFVVAHFSELPILHSWQARKKP